MKMNQPESEVFDSIMLIDDNEIENLMNKKLLSDLGFSRQFYLFTNGKSALEFLENIDNNEDFPGNFIPKLIFIDIDMPLMNGFGFLNHLSKLSSKLNNVIRLVILTQTDDQNYVKRARKIPNVVDYLIKPLDIKMVKSLQKKLSKQFASNTSI
jgi:CheY-like chemotaxis protein